MKMILPSQAMEKEFFAASSQRRPFSGAVRQAPQLMLQKTIQLALNDFLSRGHYEGSAGQALRVYRNGYEDNGCIRLRERCT